LNLFYAVLATDIIAGIVGIGGRSNDLGRIGQSGRPTAPVPYQQSSIKIRMVSKSGWGMACLVSPIRVENQ
jgi:hypothetical protein